MRGRGPGAVRYCQFTTGAFVEPIRNVVYGTTSEFGFSTPRMRMHRCSARITTL